MIYKKYEISLSLNGDKIMHIARNAAGNVIFRESNEDDLLKAIDKAIKEQEQKDKPTKESLEKPSENEEKISEEPVSETVKEEVAAPQKRVTRGPDGKFISKSQLEKEEIKKKTFWDKLTS